MTPRAKKNSAPTPEEAATPAPEAKALPTHLSSEHLLQIEKMSFEVRIAELELKLQRALLEKALVAQALAKTEVERLELLALKQNSSVEEVKRNRTTLVNELKAHYGMPDKFAYHPASGEIYRD